MAVPFQVTQEDIANGEDVEIKDEHEAWSTYELADGTTLKIKYPVATVKRLKKHQPDGNPIYFIVNSQPVVRAINIPKNLKEKPQQPKEDYR